jgi:dihydropteroate synthase
MGVVNLSGDSWYRESVCLSADAAIQRARVLQAQGADLVDIGAESTLAHAARVVGEAQRSVLLPIIRELRGSGVPVSVETYELEVARACLEAGAEVVNLTDAGHGGDLPARGSAQRGGDHLLRARAECEGVETSI